MARTLPETGKEGERLARPLAFYFLLSLLSRSGDRCTGGRFRSERRELVGAWIDADGFAPTRRARDNAPDN